MFLQFLMFVRHDFNYISWFIHSLWINFKVVQNVGNLMNDCGFGGRFLKKLQKKLPGSEI